MVTVTDDGAGIGWGALSNNGSNNRGIVWIADRDHQIPDEDYHVLMFRADARTINPTEMTWLYAPALNRTANLVPVNVH